jgi:hypothetical protein
MLVTEERTMKGKSRDLPPKEFFEEESRKRVVEGDLFGYPNPVIPIKTKGRWYGALSREAVRRGANLPDLTLGQARFVDPFLFIAVRGDESDCDEETLHTCAASVLDVASRQMRLDRLVLPVLGGRDRLKYLWIVERGLFEMADYLDAAGFPIPEHVYVTDKIPT